MLMDMAGLLALLPSLLLLLIVVGGWMKLVFFTRKQRFARNLATWGAGTVDLHVCLFIYKLCVSLRFVAIFLGLPCCGRL